jgi:hypothetical protein
LIDSSLTAGSERTRRLSDTVCTTAPRTGWSDGLGAVAGEEVGAEAWVVGAGEADGAAADGDGLGLGEPQPTTIPTMANVARRVRIGRSMTRTPRSVAASPTATQTRADVDCVTLLSLDLGRWSSRFTLDGGA